MLSNSELEELKKLLIDTQKELMCFLDEAKEGTKPVDLDEPIGRVSRGDALQQQQMALANTRGIKLRLENIKNALNRYENGEYGDCLECGECIGYKRLCAIPEAKFCIECKG